MQTSAPTPPTRPWPPSACKPSRPSPAHPSRPIPPSPCTCGARTGASGACGETVKPSGAAAPKAVPPGWTTPACGASSTGVFDARTEKPCSGSCKPWKKSRWPSGASGMGGMRSEPRRSGEQPAKAAGQQHEGDAARPFGADAARGGQGGGVASGDGDQGCDVVHRWSQCRKNERHAHHSGNATSGARTMAAMGRLGNDMKPHSAIRKNSSASSIPSSYAWKASHGN